MECGPFSISSNELFRAVVALTDRSRILEPRYSRAQVRVSLGIATRVQSVRRPRFEQPVNA
eukprot:1088329-Alexandrium_andersonii.AAC.1